jgi:hypothetical protein
VQQELSCFKILLLVAKSCEDPLKWWKAHEVQFLVIGYLACQILGIVKSQIEVKQFFSIVGILTRLHKC